METLNCPASPETLPAMLANRIKKVRVPVMRLQCVREETIAYEGTKTVGSASDVVPILREIFDGLDREVFLVLALDTKNRVLGVNVCSVGTLNQSLVHPREAFKFALLQSARAVIFAHNHPSGDPKPSREDHVVTRRLVESGEILGVPVLDHVILGCDIMTGQASRFYSFADEGTLKI